MLCLLFDYTPTHASLTLSLHMLYKMISAIKMYIYVSETENLFHSLQMWSAVCPNLSICRCLFFFVSLLFQYEYRATNNHHWRAIGNVFSWQSKDLTWHEMREGKIQFLCKIRTQRVVHLTINLHFLSLTFYFKLLHCIYIAANQMVYWLWSDASN